MDYSDFDRINSAYGESTALVRPVKRNERIRDILSRWPSLDAAYTTLSRSTSLLNAYEIDASHNDPSLVSSAHREP